MLLSYARLFLLATALVFAATGASAQTNSKQATEAAKKHQADKAAGTSAKPTTASTAAASSGPVAQRLEACKKDASWNVVKREQCVWTLCKGRWGKQGCPEEASSKSGN